MKANFFLPLAAAVILTLTACNKAESPTQVQNDVVKAENAAADNDAKAADKQAGVDATADKNVATEQQKADVQTTDAAADMAVTKAEGDNKVELAKCAALSGDAQQACKDKANALLDLAKAKAKAMKADHS